MAAVAVVDAATVAAQCLGYTATKPEKLQVVSGIVSGRDVFAVLHTRSQYPFKWGPHALRHWCLDCVCLPTILNPHRRGKYQQDRAPYLLSLSCHNIRANRFANALFAINSGHTL